jgi:ubiquinone/menaquinone biosynthesis C-methylase UbiE
MGNARERRSAEAIYDRVARFYDLYDAPMDALGGRKRRRRVLGRARGSVLEVGVGTGRNLEHYPAAVQLTGIDISKQMLDRARRRSRSLGLDVELRKGDVEHLALPDDAFDTVTATCVFCSVEHPVEGLREVVRVCKPDGQVLLLEHVRPRTRVLGWLFDRLSPFTRRLFGPEINRRTEENVHAAGLEVLDVRRDGIWREIVARPAPQPGGTRPAARTEGP